MSEIPSGKMVLLRNLHQSRKGDSVRITGVWKNTGEGLGLLCYDGVEVEIRAQDGWCIPGEGDLVQCIGELTEEPTFGILRMNARIIRTVNGMDMELYEKVAGLVNQTLKA
ncbi:hypothetical protein BY458DRAFT_508961 [Sporodiniella umbellata]|nr:hypothetical protein BY458DRAFT_508961 [Sporodiniella umbellata]